MEYSGTEHLEGRVRGIKNGPEIDDTSVGVKAVHNVEFESTCMSVGEGESGASATETTPQPETVDGTNAENRYYLKLFIGDQPYFALFDPGATISVVVPQLVEKFKERLMPAETEIQSAIGGSTKTLGKLRIWITIDDVS